MTTGKLLATAGILLALVSLSFLPAAAQSYTVKFLPTLGGSASSAVAINDRGETAGYAALSTGAQHACFWTKEGKIVDLGTLNGELSSLAQGINNAAEVVGWSGPSGFLWTAQEGMINIGSFGGISTLAFGINDSEQVVGSSALPDGVSAHAFLWTRTEGMIDLGTLGGNTSFAYAINASGVVVGGSYLSDNITVDAFRWAPETGMQDLGGLFADQGSVAFGINSHGEIVGQSGTYAFLWDETNGMHSLGTIRDSLASALGINEFHQTVGVGGTVNQIGILWRGPRMASSLQQVVARYGVVSTSAAAINKFGQIAMSGRNGDRVSSNGIVLTPKSNRSSMPGPVSILPKPFQSSVTPSK